MDRVHESPISTTPKNTVVKNKIKMKENYFFSAHEQVEFNKSCNLIGSWSGHNFLIQAATMN